PPASTKAISVNNSKPRRRWAASARCRTSRPRLFFWPHRMRPGSQAKLSSSRAVFVNAEKHRLMKSIGHDSAKPPMKTTRNLTQHPPPSPRLRVGGYAILARMADKGRATLNGTAGEYHFDCPVDNMLFSFKGVKGAEVKALLGSGASDKQ